MKCPVCKQQRTILWQREYGKPPVPVPEPFYQISYPGSKEYVSPRCSVCFDKMMEKRKIKEKPCLLKST